MQIAWRSRLHVPFTIIFTMANSLSNNRLRQRRSFYISVVFLACMNISTIYVLVQHFFNVLSDMTFSALFKNTIQHKFQQSPKKTRNFKPKGLINNTNKPSVYINCEILLKSICKLLSIMQITWRSRLHVPFTIIFLMFLNIYPENNSLLLLNSS